VRPNRGGALAVQSAVDALNVDLDELARYMPSSTDLAIVEAMLLGHMEPTNIHEHTRLPLALVHETLSQPLSAAWISATIHKTVRHRLGLVDAAMMRRALAGNADAAKILYARYGELVTKTETTHVFTPDLSRLSDADLRMLLEADKKRIDAEVIDVTEKPRAARAGKQSEGDGGAEETP